MRYTGVEARLVRGAVIDCDAFRRRSAQLDTLSVQDHARVRADDFDAVRYRRAETGCDETAGNHYRSTRARFEHQRRQRLAGHVGFGAQRARRTRHAVSYTHLRAHETPEHL